MMISMGCFFWEGGDIFSLNSYVIFSWSHIMMWGRVVEFVVSQDQLYDMIVFLIGLIGF